MKTDSSYDVVVAGGGPVGLLLAGLLGRQNLNVLLLEKRAQRSEASMAIGVTPPSLRILRRLELDRALVQRGVRITEAFIHGGAGLLGRVGFDTLPGDHPFILAVPQSATIALLEEAVERCQRVTFRRGAEVTAMEQGPASVTVTFREGGVETEATARYLAACDGHRGFVRGLAGIPSDDRDYGLNFLMADFEDRSGMGDAAHLFFTATGSVEAFPLPGGRRRWVILTEEFMEDAPEGHIEHVVRERAGFDLSGSMKFFQTPFHVRRSLARTYHRGRVALCGDAAHVMSPIGGQGMNTGFADAEFLAHALVRLCNEGDRAQDVLRDYDRFRRRAFAVASARAARGMWLGTRRGRLVTALRDAAIRRVLLKPPLRDALPSYFAMLTIPFNTLDRVPGLVPVQARGAR